MMNEAIIMPTLQINTKQREKPSK